MIGTGDIFVAESALLFFLRCGCLPLDMYFYSPSQAKFCLQQDSNREKSNNTTTTTTAITAKQKTKKHNPQSDRQRMSLADYLQNLSPLGKREVLQVARKQTRASLERSKERSSEPSSSHRDHDHKVNVVVASTVSAAAENRPQHAAAVKTSEGEGEGVGWQHAEGMRAAAKLASVATMEKKKRDNLSRGGEEDERRLPQQEAGNAHLDPLAETLGPSDLRTLGRSGGIVPINNTTSLLSTATLRNPHPSYAREGKENEEQPPLDGGIRGLGSKNASDSSSFLIATATTKPSSLPTNNNRTTEGLFVSSSSSLSTSLERATQILSARPRNEALAPMLAARLFNGRSGRSNARNEREGNARSEWSPSVGSVAYDEAAAAAYRSVTIMTPMGTIPTPSAATTTVTSRISSFPHGEGEAQEGHGEDTYNTASYNFAPPAAECSPLPLPHRPDVHVMSTDGIYDLNHDTSSSNHNSGVGWNSGNRTREPCNVHHTTSEIRADPLPFSSPLPTRAFPQKREGPTHVVVVDDDDQRTSNFQQRRYSSSSFTYSSIAVPHLSSMVQVTQRGGTFLSSPSPPSCLSKATPTTNATTNLNANTISTSSLNDTRDRQMLVAPSLEFLSPPPHDAKRTAGTRASSHRDQYYYYDNSNDNNHYSSSNNNGGGGIRGIGEAHGRDTVRTVVGTREEETNRVPIKSDDGESNVHCISDDDERVSSSSSSPYTSFGERGYNGRASKSVTERAREDRTAHQTEDGESQQGGRTDTDVRTAIFGMVSGRAQRSISPATLRLREQASVATATATTARAKRIASITDEFLGVSLSNPPFSSRSSSKSSLVPPPAKERESQREGERSAKDLSKRTVIASGLAPYLSSRRGSASVDRSGCGDGRTSHPTDEDGEDASACWMGEGSDAGESCSEAATVDYYGVMGGLHGDEDEDTHGDGAYHHASGGFGSEPNLPFARQAEKEKEKEEVLLGLKAISDSILSQLSPTTRALYPEEKHVIVCAVEAVIEFAEYGVDDGGQWSGVSSAPLKSKRNPLIASLSSTVSSSSGTPAAAAASGSRVANLVSQPVSSNTIGSRSSKAMWRLFIDWCERSRGSIVRAVGSKGEHQTDGSDGGGIRSSRSNSSTGASAIRRSSSSSRVKNTVDSHFGVDESTRDAEARGRSVTTRTSRGRGASSTPTPHRYLLTVPTSCATAIAGHHKNGTSCNSSSASFSFMMSSRGGRTRTPPPSAFPFHSMSHQPQQQLIHNRCRKDDKRWFVKGIAPLTLYDLRGVRRIAAPQPSLPSSHVCTSAGPTSAAELSVPTATKRRVVARAVPCPASTASTLFCTSLRLTLSHLHQVSIALSSRFDEWNALTPGTLEFFVVFLCLDFLVNGYRHNWKPKAVLMRADPLSSTSDSCSLISPSLSRRSSEPAKVLTISRRKMAEVLDVLFEVSDGVRD